MDALLAQAGCKGAKKVKTRIPLSPVTPNDDVLYLGLNGVSFISSAAKRWNWPNRLLS